MSRDAADVFKSKAKRFLLKLLEDDDASQVNNQQGAAGQNDLANAFGNLSVSPNPPTGPYNSNAGPGFVGGFHPVMSAGADAYPPGPPSFPSYPSSSSRPSAHSHSSYTSEPVSLTMQHALRPPNALISAPVHASAPHLATSSTSTPSSHTSASPSKPSTPSKTKPKRTRADSDPSTGNAGQVQCSGITKAGKRCTRMVKVTVPPPDDDDDDDDKKEAFCHQHSKELLLPSGYYARKNGEWVVFNDWIPEYLQPDTQVALRVEMEKARTQSDVPGYIYTFEIRESPQSKTIKLKVGRAVNLVKRIDQWGKQCGSKEQVLRGFYPGAVEDGQDASDISLMKGRVQAGEKAAWCHRLERLIHLELADIAATCIYLDPSWPNPKVTSDSPVKRSPNAAAGNTKPCPDCGQMHKEIFEFRRWEKGKNKGKEWELVVKPVIERWGKFIELYL